MSIDKIHYELSELLKEKYSGVLTNPKVLYKIPLKTSLEVVELNPLFLDLDKEVRESEAGREVSKVLLAGADVAQKYNQAKRVFGRVRGIFENGEGIFPLEEEELDEVEEELLSKNNTSEDLVVKPLEIYETICKYFANNESIDSGVFRDGQIIEENMLEKLKPKVAYHARKTAFDTVCANIFGRYIEDYTKGLMVDFVKSKENETSVFFVSMDKIENTNFPQIKEVIDRRGDLRKVINKEITKKTMRVACNVSGKDVFVELPIYQGVITVAKKK